MSQGTLNFEDPRRIYQISDLLELIRVEAESQYRGVWIQGEISNFKRHSASGHLYFTLKDRNSQLAAVCFRSQANVLKISPKDGDEVLIRGTVTVYAPRGQLQVRVDHMEPVGQGALQLEFEKLKQRLNAEGLFAPAHKRPLPLLPSRIGVVTSPTGAAIQDILRVLKTRNDRVSVLIYPARVQGKGAAKEIVEGINALDAISDIDVIIVGRGGGSLEDLWPFNEEILARAIHAATKPVISAVGHEIDFTISDFVADVRAATPSAAAEMVAARREDLREKVALAGQRLGRSIRHRLVVKRSTLDRLSRSRGMMDLESRIRLIAQRLDDATDRLWAGLPPLLRTRRQQLTVHHQDLLRSVNRTLERAVRTHESLREKLHAYSPLLVLERGYAIVTDARGRVVRDPAEVDAKELIDVQVARGRFRARKEPV